MEFNYKNILIFGYGRSGRAVEEILKDIKVPYKIYDKKVRIGGGCYVRKLTKKVISQFDLIVVSPGVSVYNRYLRLAESIGIKVIGELEFGYWFTTAKIIGVTGTNGKTSTVQLITDMLQNAGFKAESFGNIGVPLCSAYKRKLDYIVCEVSSFQLETTDKFVCDVGVLLNVAEDHIDRHKTLKNYINAKKDLFKNCNTDSIVVLNADDAICQKFSGDVAGKILLTSKSNVIHGVYFKNGVIYDNTKGKSVELINVGKHKLWQTYIDNIMAMVVVGLTQKISKEVMLKTLKNWKIMPHRLELVSKSKGVVYINDSKSTNIHSVNKAVDSVNGNIILLLGGQNKKLNFANFFKSIPHNVRSIVTFGECKKYLTKLSKKYQIDVTMAKDLNSAVQYSATIARSGDTILFSPGCTSFDEFNSYAERGDYFKKLVWDMVGNENK